MHLNLVCEVRPSSEKHMTLFFFKVAQFLEKKNWVFFIFASDHYFGHFSAFLAVFWIFSGPYSDFETRTQKMSF